MELPETQHRFDDAEHRFRRLLAQGIVCQPSGVRQPMHHRLKCCRLPTEVVAFAAWGDQQCDLARRTPSRLLGEIAAVRQQGLVLAQRLGKLPELFQHRFDLLFVVGGLHDIAWAL